LKAFGALPLGKKGRRKKRNFFSGLSWTEKKTKANVNLFKIHQIEALASSCAGIGWPCKIKF
jgi:hypothetical protein